MQHRVVPAFTVTADGIMLYNLPLTKNVMRAIAPQSQRYIRRADELIAEVKKEDWDNRIPHDGYVSIKRAI